MEEDGKLPKVSMGLTGLTICERMAQDRKSKRREKTV
jgi:hypothetical protein